MQNIKSPYSIAIIGAGAAGIMAAIETSSTAEKVLLIERNSSIGKKILLTGKGRCNITNNADIDTFIEKFGKSGKFLRTAFTAFSNHDLIEFFKAKGLSVKVERQGRVFPATDTAASVVDLLRRCLSEKKITILYNMRLRKIKKERDLFCLTADNSIAIYAKKVIIATGGASYKVTGSSGDGIQLAKGLRHTIVPLKPALVPLKTREAWVKKLQGLPLKNVRLTFSAKKKIISDIGEMIFTHFGISGPLVLDLSGEVVSMLNKEMPLSIDLKVGLDEDKLTKRLLKEFGDKSNMQLKNIMKDLLPQRLIPVFLDIAKINPEKKANQISKKERDIIIKLLKALPLTIKGPLPIEEAMVTNGGVSTKEINPRTMESKVVSGLYFAGEIIDGCAPSGGYNLQQAFSTGYLAGESAAHA